MVEHLAWWKMLKELSMSPEVGDGSCGCIIHAMRADSSPSTRRCGRTYFRWRILVL
jgi:hypothetical protein